jgi:hypothetical protein
MRFAVRKAERHEPMTMADWSKHLDQILTAGGEQLLKKQRANTANISKRHSLLSKKLSWILSRQSRGTPRICKPNHTN